MERSQSSGKFVSAGTTLFHEGDEGEGGFFIESGAVECWVTRGGERVSVATHGAGEFLGEMSAIDGEPRSTSATAITDCELIEFSNQQLKHRLDDMDPVMRHLILALIKRIRSTNAKISKAFGSMVAAPTPSSSKKQPDDGCLQDLRLELELLRAVANEEFELFFQPIINLKNKGLRGFEALVRWNHPLKGLVNPAEFIEFAEEQDIIANLTNWCVQKTCEIIPRFQQAALHNIQHAGPLFVAVNISGRNLGSLEFSEWTENVIKASNCPPDLLRLEVTETSLMTNSQAANEGLHKLKEMGVGIAIDDFGTGHSSLAYLNQLPMTCIKVDRSFVSGMLDNQDNKKVVKLIVSLAKELGVTVVAEGIESEKEARILEEMNCDLGQGYYFAKPMPLRQALEFVRAWKPEQVLVPGNENAVA